MVKGKRVGGGGRVGKSGKRGGSEEEWREGKEEERDEQRYLISV